VAHALLQAREEVEELMAGFPSEHLPIRPEGAASPGFHLRHLAGVLDRLFTYARGETLSAEQVRRLDLETSPVAPETCGELVNVFRRQVDIALDQLRSTPVDTLTERREVGRAKLPSTVLGLLFHAAEHTQRHVGQLLVTVRLLHPWLPGGQESKT
jgi:hypothetical protein